MMMMMMPASYYTAILPLNGLRLSASSTCNNGDDVFACGFGYVVVVWEVRFSERKANPSIEDGIFMCVICKNINKSPTTPSKTHADASEHLSSTTHYHTDAKRRNDGDNNQQQQQ